MGHDLRKKNAGIPALPGIPQSSLRLPNGQNCGTAEIRPFCLNLRNSGVLCGCQTTPKILRAAVIYFQVAFTPKEARKNRRCVIRWGKLHPEERYPMISPTTGVDKIYLLLNRVMGSRGFTLLWASPPRRTIPIFAQWPSQNSLNIAIHREDYD